MHKKFKAFIKLFFFSKKYSYKSLTNSLLTLLNYKVSIGPFKGMQYINQSNGSVLIPKIVGVYECELHEIIYNIINRNYNNIIDIGAAEGYYAVGFAYAAKKRNKPINIFAYDINKEALKNLKKLAEINNVTDCITINHEFTYYELDKYLQSTSLIICDIEGEEKNLLNLNNHPSLVKFDILVEVHDGIDNPIIENQLINQFTTTHTIKKIVFNPNHSIRQKVLPFITNRNYVKNILNEGRKFGLVWLFLEKKKN